MIYVMSFTVGRDDSCNFLKINFFFQFYPSILNRLTIKLYNYFLTCFVWGYYGLITWIASFVG